MKTKLYTVQQVAEIAKLTTQRINQYRVSKSKTGFKLVEGKDWHWERGKIVYTISAVNKLNKRSGE